MKELIKEDIDSTIQEFQGCDDVEGDKGGDGVNGKAPESLSGGNQNFGGKGEGNGEAHS